MIKEIRKLHRELPDAAMIKKLYRNSIKRIPLIGNTVFSIKENLRYLNGTYAKFRMPSWRQSQKKQGLKIAVICDRLTWDNMKNLFEVVYLTPSNWWEVLEEFKPDLFFCEATWEGIDMSWDNQVYRNPMFKKDNRSVLKNILCYCQYANIPSVFWNKEDSPVSTKKEINFDETALLFDHVFTTAIECIPKYEALGHKSVHLMMFGYSPELFSLKKLPDNNTAVFFGSWYNDLPERCADMEAVFDMVISEGLDLVIYDRASETDNPILKYPEKYSQYIVPAVPYEQVSKEMENARYIININSVKDSKTMFARRVFEAMACGRIVISNESVGMRALFPGKVWFAGDVFSREKELEIISQNMTEVAENYTFKKQFLTALQKTGIQ